MRLGLSVLFFIAVAGTGCISVPMKFREEPKTAKAPSTASTKPDRPPVTPDDVSENNARDTAGALSRELDGAGRPTISQSSGSTAPCKH
jgi:hypothetical protein